METAAHSHRKLMSTRRRSDRQSNEHGVTRRDFLGTALLGAGGALLTAEAPARAFAATQAKLPYAKLGPQWSGPGGLGDYAHSNGNVYETVNTAHALRDGYPLEAHVLTDRESAFDLIVVGGGISGLMSSYEFLKAHGGKARVLLLDNHPIFGGEAKQNDVEIDGYHLTAPQGSNMFLWPAKAAEQTTFWHPVWREIGLPTGEGADSPVWITRATGTEKPLRFSGENFLEMMIGRLDSQQAQFFRDPRHPSEWRMTRNPWEKDYRDFPWPEQAKRELIHLDRLVKPLPKDFERWLDSLTYRDYLAKVVGVTQQEVFDYVSPMIAAYGCGLGCDAISAYAAWVFRAPGFDWPIGTPKGADVASFPGGNAGIARHFVKRLIPDAISGGDDLHDILYGAVDWNTLDRAGRPMRMRLNVTAVDVRHEGPPGSKHHALVTYVDNRTGKAYRIHGKTVIMASGQWMNKHVIRDAPEPLRAAMDQFDNAPMLVINVGVRNWRFIEKLGVTSARWLGGVGWFTNVRGPMSLGGQHMPLDPDKPTMLTFYDPYTCLPNSVTGPEVPLKAKCIVARQALLSLPYRDIETALREQLAGTFGPHGLDVERDIASFIINRWGHAYVVPQPGFYFGKNGAPAPRDIVRQGYGRVRFAHSELSGTQLWSSACAEGERAARQVLELV